MSILFILKSCLTVYVAQCPEDDNKDQNGGDAAAAEFPRRRACEYSS